MEQSSEWQKADSIVAPDKQLYRYAEGKWTVKEILVHVIDDERIYGFAHNDKTELPGFDQDPFAFHSKANETAIESILEEYEAVRMSTITLFDSFSDDVLLRRGTMKQRSVHWDIISRDMSFTISILLRVSI